MRKLGMPLILLLVVASCVLAKEFIHTNASKNEDKFPLTLSRGWGDNLYWTQTYEEALHKSKTTNRPLMVIHHLEECPHSKALKKAFSESKEIQKLAEQFVMINFIAVLIVSNQYKQPVDIPLSIVTHESWGPLHGWMWLKFSTASNSPNMKHQTSTFYPDGQYVPRILFVDPSMTVRADITGRYSNRLYAYEPSDTNLLINNMKKALKMLKPEL